MADTLRVLYVDDEAGLLEIGKLFLQQSGDFSVTTIDSAPAAIELLGQEQFDAIISDYQMPVMDGIQFLIEVREKFDKVPFILFTGKGREEVVIQAINSGADFYLQKGGNPEAQFAELVHMIKQAASRKRAEAALKENERTYRNLYQYAQVGLFETSLRDGTVIACNERYATLAGFSSVEDAIGKDIVHLYVNTDDRNVVSRILHEQGHIEDHIVLFQKHQTGHQFWAQFSARINREKDVAEGTIIDISELKQAEWRQYFAAEILGILNDPANLVESINLILAAVKRETGFDAVGIRLKAGDDFPYFVQDGFSPDFLLTENSLVARDATGGPCRDENGNISLECTCGLVLSGQTDPKNPLFTEWGSSWTNNSLPFLDLPPEQDPRFHPRNNCIHQGYLSVALIPIRANRQIIGLLQLNDRRKDRFTPEMIHFYEGIVASIGIALIRKQAEDALENEKRRLASIIEGTRAGTWEWNVQTGETIFNERWAGIIGYTLAEISPVSIETWKKYAHPDDLQKSGELLERHFRRESEWYECESRMKHKNGDWVWVLDRGKVASWTGEGKPLWMFGTHQDITERKHSEVALHHLTEFQESVITNARVWLSVLDLKGTILMWNAAAAEISGYRQDDVIGSNTIWKMLYPEQEYRKQVTTTINRIIREKKYLENFETVIRTKEGDEKVISWNTKGIPDAEGTIADYIAIGVDITDRKRAEEQLNKTVDELKRFNNQTLDRELRMIALKEEINGLLKDSGQQEKYRTGP
ncbi:MAG: PAS domain S-box protein [Methanomicrobiales archaeon]